MTYLTFLTLSDENVLKKSDFLSHLNESNKPIEEGNSPFSIKKRWNYRTLHNQKMQSRTKTSGKKKVKKVKFKKSRVNVSHIKNNISSLCNKIGGVKNYMEKHHKKFTSTCYENNLNKVSTMDNSSIISTDAIQVHNETENTISATRGGKSEKLIETEELKSSEYTQYLELKPSVKFKCYLCGTNDFSSITLLQRHIATCSGKTSIDSFLSASPQQTKRASTSTSTATPNLRITRKVFLCSSCGTYYQNYNLYIHMRDKHNKQICLLCRNIFPKSQQLWDHLVNVHSLTSIKYSNIAEIRHVFKNSFYITCCSCNTIFSDEDRFDQHKCETNLSHVTLTPSAYCLGCKSSNDNVDLRNSNSKESTIDKNHFGHEPVVSMVEDKYRPLPSSTDEDDEFKLNFSHTFMSRNSTLEFIGVPEKHTVTSLPEEDEKDEYEITKTSVITPNVNTDQQTTYKHKFDEKSTVNTSNLITDTEMKIIEKGVGDQCRMSPSHINVRNKNKSESKVESKQTSEAFKPDETHKEELKSQILDSCDEFNMTLYNNLNINLNRFEEQISYSNSTNVPVELEKINIGKENVLASNSELKRYKNNDDEDDGDGGNDGDGDDDDDGNGNDNDNDNDNKEFTLKYCYYVSTFILILFLSGILKIQIKKIYIYINKVYYLIKNIFFMICNN